MHAYIVFAIIWGAIFASCIFPLRADYRIECPGTLGWRIATTLIHAAIWPFSLLQIVGWWWLDNIFTP